MTIAATAICHGLPLNIELGYIDCVLKYFHGAVLYCFDLLVPERIVFSGGRSLRSESLDKSGVLYNSTIPQPGIHKNLPFGK